MADLALTADRLLDLAFDDFADDFERRFCLQLVELYGSTDAGLPLYHPIDVPRRLLKIVEYASAPDPLRPAVRLRKPVLRERERGVECKHALESRLR